MQVWALLMLFLFGMLAKCLKSWERNKEGDTPTFISITGGTHFDDRAFCIFRNGWIIVELLFILFSVYNTA